jgi:glutamate/tyrosine decarboxylase-like PLP-dependent enzyme
LGEQYGVDVHNSGLWRLPPVTVIASSYVHPTTTKAVGMLGFGRESVHVLADNDTGEMDINRLRQALDRADDSPVIVILTAGDVDTGRFDPIREVTVACRSRNAWVHVDGAFGLFARVSPSRRYLADGVELAQSVSVDAHKWLNVPFDSGLVYVRDIRYLESAFATTAAFLDDPGLTLMDRCPENSRRARGIAIWASLMAYGRSGFQELVDRHLCLANRLGRQVKGAPDFELMAPVSLNVVAFRWKPEDLPESEVDTLNQDIAKILLEDGQIFVGSLARINGRVGFRAIILNWRTREEDIDNIIPRVRAAGLIHRNRKTSF